IGGNCFLNLKNEVWFTFIPETPAMYIKITGAAFSLGTLRNPAVAVFEGNCNNLTRVGCNIASANKNQVELSVEGLVIGKVYYLLVEGQNLNTGTFQICLNGFIPPPNPQSDCSKAVVLCDESPFIVDTLLGTGIQDPDVTNTCVMQELSSAWYKWTCRTSGTFTFVITPNGYVPNFESDDIDFVLYELPNGLDDCDNKTMIRCMASGANTNETFQSWKRCNGPTGLAVGDPDMTEPAGCRIASQNNFVAAVDMVAGKSYALLVNNFSQTGLGFSIQFGGSATFQGPIPDFDVTAVQAFECDKTVIFDNQSTAPTDSIVQYQWNFGAGANPTFNNTPGPISVVYQSFGSKKVALTVTSSKGCVVTDILDFYIEPCCADTSTLNVTANIQDQICPGTASGYIQGVGISGAPDYQFSLDCINYQPASVFPFLMPGDYTLCIQDEKGCKNQVQVQVLPATNYGVEAGDTIFVQLGDPADLHAVAFPALPSSVTWNHQDEMTFPGSTILDLLNPTALPPTTGWYTVTIENDAGCIASDSVLIVVDPYKPIYIPNVFSANNDGINDRLTVYGNKAATGVQVFQIFDRWGGLMWEGKNFDLNDPSLGWDGTCKGKPVETGVYAYRARVNFLDNIPVTYTGTVTVVR
ncbi:MAG TPA: gliding motility-associated C-terminal domain-containing protein, partial [Saprospiraceae bacterium]|nr:gliding motility-associated C-terminal domain-containing protein [Saprospiraceae bacterium]